MKSLNILFIPKWYPAEAETKEGVFVEEFAKAASLYNNITILFVYPAKQKIRGLYEIREETNEKIKIIKVRHKLNIPLPGILETLIFNWLTKYIYKKHLAGKYKPDLIHAHVFSAGPSALAIGKLAKAPVILSAHSLELASQQELTFEFRLLAKHVLKKFSRILPVSPYLEKTMRNLAPLAKYTIVPNVVNTDLFYPEPVKPHSKIKILTISLLTYVKRIQDLLKAIAQIKKRRQDFVLDIVGDGPERKMLEKLVATYQINDCVNFHGLKSKSEVAGFMRNCDFFTQPSQMETFGCVFIESLACGKPVVATQVGNITNLISPERGLLVPAKDPIALEHALEKMLDNYSRYSSEKIVQYARDNFSYDAVAKKLNNIYQEVINEWKTNNE